MSKDPPAVDMTGDSPFSDEPNRPAARAPEQRESGAAREPGRELDVRHSRAAEAPIDGDYQFGSVVIPDGHGGFVAGEQDPEWEYATLSDADMPTFQARGYIPVRFGKDSARWRHDPRNLDGADDGYREGSHQKMGGCTLMKVRKDQIAARRKAEREVWDLVQRENDQVAIRSGGVAAHTSQVIGG